MTLVIALRSRDGAVMAADSQLTFRDAARNIIETRRVTKLMANGALVWGWAGEEDTQQDVAMQLLEGEPIDVGGKRSEIKTRLQDAAREVFTALEDEAKLRLLFAWWSPDDGKAIVMRTIPYGKSVPSFFLDEQSNVEMIGSPSAMLVARFGQRFLGFGDLGELTLEQAKALVYKLIVDVAGVVDDVDDQITLFTVTKDGPEQLSREELDLLADTAGGWTDSMRGMISGGTPSEAAGPDHGIAPPEDAP
jgi:hypothetical protein